MQTYGALRIAGPENISGAEAQFYRPPPLQVIADTRLFRRHMARFEVRKARALQPQGDLVRSRKAMDRARGWRQTPKDGGTTIHPAGSAR